MTNEDIIRMAREARLAEHTHPYQLWSASDDGLERFANLVAAAEREACAVIAFNAKTYIEAAEAIRARGKHD
jgi:DNA-binding LacI/PurR family transcriptional regulator